MQEAARGRAAPRSSNVKVEGGDGEGIAPPSEMGPRTASGGGGGEIAPGSCRGMAASLDLDAWLGRPVPPPPGTAAMKAAVMALLRCGDPCGAPPRFNKYSGVQEWANRAALFVNVDGGFKNYDNDFEFREEAVAELGGGDGGGLACRMMWYAGSRVREDSPMVERLLASGQPAKCAEGGSGAGNDGGEQGDAPSSVPLLFCRLPGMARAP